MKEELGGKRCSIWIWKTGNYYHVSAVQNVVQYSEVKELGFFLPQKIESPNGILLWKYKEPSKPKAVLEKNIIKGLGILTSRCYKTLVIKTVVMSKVK